ncbi:VCBS domain-containing protein, partial [Vibrio sp. OPT18]|uniref:VCBS domain-containing protein n=1 Tax=Vibrio sp. OPT18 TaxID=2778641 RepID=UPI00187E7D2F
FDPSHATYQALAQGEVRRIHIPIKVSDGHGDSADEIIIEVTGTNDIPVMSATTVHTQENARVVNGVMNATDADSHDILTYT